ncbi:MAG: peptidase M15 [Deltaproteobacteria bacterium]|nr:MAG: peptidase M15 [Deltaproteobacteria bacterium]
MKRLNDFQLSKHFNLREFMCPCCGRVKIYPDLIEALELLRKYIGAKPIYITSGYRCPEHNRAIGGAPDSDHLYGYAADIVVEGMSGAALALAATAFPTLIKRIGTYDGNSEMVHIGIQDRSPLPSRWGPVWSEQERDDKNA